MKAGWFDYTHTTIENKKWRANARKFIDFY